MSKTLDGSGTKKLDSAYLQSKIILDLVGYIFIFG